MFRKKPVIYTYWAGDKLPDYAEHCVSTVKEYADNIGVPYHHLTGNAETAALYPHPAWGKLDVLRAFVRGSDDRMLYLDCDIRVNRNTPDVFKTFSGDWMRRDSLIEYQWPKEFEQWIEHQYGITNHTCQPYFNTGVMLLSKSFVKKWLRQMDAMKWVNHGSFEQHLFNLALKETGQSREVNWLPSTWNWLNVTKKEFNRKDVRWFDHFASKEGKKLLNQSLL